ncbi:efflux transporter outer membrane subunit [Janthinobacterium sp. 17J80-10]|uniref:efflux transporter outer membrane subunit n=1 Tax=Janthinobacterium sp. 17J80-10 TaxID=2497863 RepID=UPI0010054E81|nr:efflux transporter outer membrane subunit [Janthinobacterium sp. 17J80-10]QAU33044.1 efflux transporter outer membrane subunit [Janthinobacterium sp. 17J80-10]
MTHFKNIPIAASSALLSALLILAGCSVAPVYQRPAAGIPAAFKEAAAPVADTAAQWKAAQPAEEAARGQWWKVFGDDALNALEDQALLANQDLKAGAARLGQARALEQSARAGLFPQVGVGIGPTRQRPSAASQGLAPGTETAATTLWRAQAGFSYEADLFGRVNSVVDAAGADAQRNTALFQSLLLAIQADVAQAYFLVRELDAEQSIYTSTVALRGQTLKLLQRRFEEGDIGEVDVARARAELAAAQSESFGVVRRRAIAEHALAILLGKTPADFSSPQRPLTRIAITVPAGLPSALLERRPDIAAAERAMAAANARIGSANAAFFPRLSITGALGFESRELGDLFNWSSRTFLLGPLLGTILSLPVFDGGARQAEVDRAGASYDEDVAKYRQAILKAFGEVEDNLATLRILGDQTLAQDEAVNASARAAKLSHLQYREGSVSYLNVIDADRSVLQQQRVAVQLDGERARSTVNLIRAIGGGWGEPERLSQAPNEPRPMPSATAAWKF